MLYTDVEIEEGMTLRGVVRSKKLLYLSILFAEQGNQNDHIAYL